jgi:hypothetical protein
MYAVEPGIGLEEKKALNANWKEDEILRLASHYEHLRGAEADRED